MTQTRQRPASRLGLAAKHPVSRAYLAVFGFFFVALGGYIIFQSGHAATSCSLNATPSTLASQVTAATAGQTICLTSGNYGTWTGTNKAITVTAQAGAAVTMSGDFGLGDANFTIDGLTLDGVTIVGNYSNNGSSDRPQNITIKNSTFTSALYFDAVANTNILIDHNTFKNIDVGAGCTGSAGRVTIMSENSTVPTGITVSNSYMSGGNSDGVNAGAPATIIGNEFYDINEKSSSDCAHTDAIQLYGGQDMVIRGNYIHGTADGIVAYDGTSGNLVEDNVIDLEPTGRWGIELYADNGSIVRHNTLRYSTNCTYPPCGEIILDHKSQDPAGKNTVVENNIATSVDPSNGSTAAVNNKNMLHSGASGTNFNGVPEFIGGTAPASYAAFALAAGSPGKGAASDGLDVGIRLSAGPPPSPSASTTPTPTPVGTKVGDVNLDNAVNLVDLSLLLSHWGGSYAAADFNHDGVVNLVDLSLLLSHWGT